ncbi:MAG: DUF5005 domain-containing protein [Alistipes sp.]
MKKNILAICIISLFTGNLVACNDFENPEIPYDQPEDQPAAITPPQIETSWNLELMANEGQQDSHVFVYKDKKYDALFTRTLGWNGGDGVLTTALPDGNIYWTFNDSFYGVVDADTRARQSCSFPRNSLMIQTGESGEEDLVWLADFVQTKNPDAERYYHARTHFRHPKATLSESEIERGEIDQDYVYWAGDATVYKDPARSDVLQMLWIGVDLTGGSGSMVNFSSCLREYNLNGTPGDGQYMSELSCDHNFKSNGYGYGATMFEDKDGHIYLYTTKQEGLSSRVLVARTETLDLRSEWSYYIRDVNGEFHWQTALPTKDEQIRSYISAHSGSMPWIIEKEGVYYMIMESFPFGRDIYIYRSDKPYGPFTDRKLLFTLPATLDKIGNPYHQRWYMINLHPALSRDGELVFSTNSDPNNFWDNFNRVGSADFYRPFFFRVFNWEKIYDIE